MGLTRFELVTPRLSSVCSNQLSYRPRYALQRTVAGSLKTRQCALLSLARPFGLAGLLRSRGRKTPLRLLASQPVQEPDRSLNVPSRLPEGSRYRNHSRKEVIQPQVLLQLPCYDFTPITDHTLGASLPCGLVWRLLVQPAFVM